jgi:hypothetical protein
MSSSHKFRIWDSDCKSQEDLAPEGAELLAAVARCLQVFGINPVIYRLKKETPWKFLFEHEHGTKLTQVLGKLSEDVVSIEDLGKEGRHYHIGFIPTQGYMEMVILRGTEISVAGDTGYNAGLQMITRMLNAARELNNLKS